MTTPKARENNARRAATRQGLRLVKSRTSDLSGPIFRLVRHAGETAAGSLPRDRRGGALAERPGDEVTRRNPSCASG